MSSIDIHHFLDKNARTDRTDRTGRSSFFVLDNVMKERGGIREPDGRYIV